MPSLRHGIIRSGIVAMVVASSVRPGSGQSEPLPALPAASASAAAAPPTMFAGVWDYNAADSINVATGRAEQSPRGATQRTASGRVVSRSVADSGRIDVARANGLGPTPAMMREARDMSRDLLEVPEALTIAVSDDAVTITDDLERGRTYRTDNEKHQYQLGASEFQARVRWDGARLRKEVEGAFGFRMSEVYFLSADAQRLFVIVRVGDTTRGRPPVGFDRVYDRIE